MGELSIFIVLALLTMGAALLVIVQRNPVYSALFLVLTFVAQAGLFVLLRAQFIAAVQVIINAGAVMVLFLFVIMLLDLKREPVVWLPKDRIQLILGIALALAFLLEMASIMFQAPGSEFQVSNSGLMVGPRPGTLHPGPGAPSPLQEMEAVGNTQVIGRLLFTDFLFPFEITSVILLVAIVGAMVLAKRRLD